MSVWPARPPVRIASVQIVALEWNDMQNQTFSPLRLDSCKGSGISTEIVVTQVIKVSSVLTTESTHSSLESPLHHLVGHEADIEVAGAGSSLAVEA